MIITGQMSCNSITGKVGKRKKEKKKRKEKKPFSSLKVKQNFFLTEPFDTLVYLSAVPAQYM